MTVYGKCWEIFLWLKLESMKIILIQNFESTFAQDVPSYYYFFIPLNLHFRAPEISEISTFFLVLLKCGKISQFSMEISNTTFISQKNNIGNLCVRLNLIYELSSKKKQFQISNIWENSDKITVKITKKADNRKNPCKLEYKP